MSTLQGDIFRCHYTCTTEHDRDNAINDLTEIKCLPPNSYTRNTYVLRFFGTFSKIVLNSNILPNSYGFLKCLL